MSHSARATRRLVSMPEAAAYIGCTTRTVRRRIADGTIRAYRLGRLVRVDLADVDAALRRIPTAGGAA